MSWRRGEKPSRRRWARVRLTALDRDGWACVKCGKAGRLEADHRVPLEDGGAVYDLANIQSLCRGSHFAKTSGERRGRETPPEVQEWRRYLTRNGF